MSDLEILSIGETQKQLAALCVSDQLSDKALRLFLSAHRHIAELEEKIEWVNAVSFEVHDSWGVSDEFKDGWRECRKQIEEALGEVK